MPCVLQCVELKWWHDRELAVADRFLYVGVVTKQQQHGSANVLDCLILNQVSDANLLLYSKQSFGRSADNKVPNVATDLVALVL